MSIDVNWDAPARGILECRIKVTTDDELSAAQAIAPYLAEQLRALTVDMDVPCEAALLEQNLRWRLSLCVDPLSSLLTLHLFTQLWLKQGIEQILVQPNLQGYQEMVAALANAENITADLAHNLKQLNWLRNQFAHGLGTKWRDLDLHFKSFHGVELWGVRASAKLDSDLHVFKVLDKLILLTYQPLVEQLTNHCVTLHSYQASTSG
jgi:hypothetical protein